MTKVGKLWTGAVAYISLLVGAGLSVAGNVADTYRVRADRTDALDLTMAAGWPILVLLAIEMFVSPRWSTKRMFQVWRWVGCLAVGGMAMVVSWTHLNDLMESRGQLDIVAILGPLAIDGMAIMATGLILSTRGHVASVATGQPDVASVASVASGQLDMDKALDMANPDDQDKALDNVFAVMDMDTGHLPPQDIPLGQADNPLAKILESADWRAELDDFDRKIDLAIRRTGQELATEVENYVAGSGPARPATPTVAGVPADARELLEAWMTSDGFAVYGGPDVDALLAGWFGRTARTARRWRAAVQGRPTSGPPAAE